MEQKKKYYFSAVIVLLAALTGYHFLAASEAENQIDQAIQEQANKHDSLSVQYSSIHVSPFAATVSFRDLTILFGDHIERTNHLQLNLNYIDFLNIYFGGARYGLEQLSQAKLSLTNASYLNKSKLQEVKADTLTVSYEGNALDGLVHAINGTPYGHSQSIEAESSGFTISVPQTSFNKVKAREFRYSATIADGSSDFWTSGSHQIGIDSLVWTPSTAFQETYSFFIRGFGYPTDAIPFQSAQFQAETDSLSRMMNIQSSVKSELALLTASGSLTVHHSTTDARFHNMKLSVSEFSPTFENVLGNIEQLAGLTFPKQNGKIVFQLEGTISDPVLSQ